MRGLKTIDDPAVLNFLLTEDLYAIKDIRPVRREAPAGEAERIPKAKQASEANKNAGEKAPAKDPGPASEAAQARGGKSAGAEVFHYLGENRKFILALVNYPDEKYLPLAEKEYLEKVLSSVQVTLEDIALLNYARYPEADYHALKDFFAFDRLLLFGLSPNLLRIPGPVLPYHLGLVEGVKILAADSPETLRPDNAKKRALWQELKRIFSR